MFDHLTTLMTELKDPNLHVQQFDIGVVRENQFELFLIALRSSRANGMHDYHMML